MSAQTTAAPCRSCGTTGGFIPRRDGVRPMRVHGYCNACYQRARAAGFPAVVPPPNPPGRQPTNPPIAHTCAYCGAGFMAYASQAQRCCSVACAQASKFPEHPAPIPAGLAPILRGPRDWPVWDGLAKKKYPATTWRTARWHRRPKDPTAARLYDRETAQAA